MKKLNLILGMTILLYKYCLGHDLCREAGGKCMQVPVIPDDDIDEELEQWFEECQPLGCGDFTLCENPDEFCCSGDMSAYQMGGGPKTIFTNLADHDLELSFPETENRPDKSDPNKDNNPDLPGFGPRAFGKKCRDNGGQCKWGPCHYGSSSPDDCLWWRHCCKKPPCNRKLFACTLKGGHCYQKSCPFHLYQINNGCSTNYGPTCRCCAPCKKKFLQCLGGRCTTGSCKDTEVKFYGKCRSDQCHCCQPCRRKFLRCLNGRCTKEQCNPDTEVTYKGLCTHKDCHCCGPCKKKLFRCIDGRCIKIHIKCETDEESLLGQCSDESCHCCKKSCPDFGCVEYGGRCKSYCPIFFIQLSQGKCGNNCKCCKFVWPFPWFNQEILAAEG